MTPAADARPAGFWQRAVGWSLDAALLAPVALALVWPWTGAALQVLQARADALLRGTGTAMAHALVDSGATGPAGLVPVAAGLMHDPALRQASAALQPALWAAAWPPVLAFAVLGAAWQAGFESSRWQASPGRRLLGLHATDRHGRRLGPARALARHAGGALSWLTLNIGHAMAASAPAHLALHDRISGTRMRSAGPGLPRWAWAWLALLAVALFAATAWLARYASAVMLAALEAALY